MQAANMTVAEERQLMESALALGLASRAQLRQDVVDDKPDSWAKWHQLNSDIKALETELAK